MFILEINPIESQGSIAPTAIVSKKGYEVVLKGFSVTMAFKVDVRRDTTRRKAIIDRQYGKELRVLIGSATEDTYGFVEGWQTATNAWYAVYYKAPGDLGTKRFWVKTHANADKIWGEASKL